MPLVMASRSLLVLPLVTLMGCASVQSRVSPDTVGSEIVEEDPYVRAAAAGLTPAQASALLEFDAPILLPRAMDGWTVDRVETIDLVEIEETIPETIPIVVGYIVRWKRPDGACVEVSGTGDGLGGPEYPIVSREVTLRELPGAPRYRVFKAADDPASTSAQNWGPGTVLSEVVEVGTEAGYKAFYFYSRSEDGCRPLSLDEASPLFASLRPLDPARLGDEIDMGAFGRFGLADDVFASFITDVPATQDPEAAVREWVEGWEAEEILVETVGEGFILALLDGLADDSIRGERLVFVFERQGSGWGLRHAGRQVRCWPGRGHQDWTPEPCL